MSYVITDAFEGKQYIYDRKPEFMNGLQEILDKHKEKERAIYEHEFGWTVDGYNLFVNGAKVLLRMRAGKKGRV